MKASHCSLLFAALLLLWTACSRDKELTNDGNTTDITAQSVSNINKSPGLLLGSWNLTKDNSTQNIEKTATDCKASNIHFLEDNTFYLKYLDKRIRGKYEIIDSTSLNLVNGSEIIGTATKIEVIENEINLTLEVNNECNDSYTGEKYFRIHQFIWETLNDYYLWQEEVAVLNDSIKPVGSSRYKELIDPYPEPEAFFESLKHKEDKYSVIRSNYEDLENSIKGIDANNGLEFVLSRYGSGDSVLGVVTYILEASDAATKDIKRGDIFTGVDGKNLTLNNYTDLLYGDNLSYTLNMAELNNNLLSPNGKNISLTKTENFQSNPIQISKVIKVGEIKVGYIMYNQFAQGFDDDLNEIFSDFKAKEINELVLDLRYNGGGLVRSATSLAGMITGQFNGQVFAKYLWNKKLMTYLNDNQEQYASWLGENFTDKLAEGDAINSLNLNKVYIITSGRSASSSELVINGLSPYIDVIQVGDDTYGKNVGGPAAQYDYIDNNRTKNPDHTYAIYCMTFFSANSEDFYDYADGLAPDDELKLKEDLKNMGTLGESAEPLLALALKHLSPEAARYKVKTPVFPLENMVDDPEFIKNKSITTFKTLPLLQLD
jgi:C-terminal processing protease CtpA/Prc|tara:strand:- start:35168 stop:36973 length:1806 start_codon:yes stop_codon:yes gene_type:complete